MAIVYGYSPLKVNLTQEQLDYFDRQYGGFDVMVSVQRGRWEKAAQTGNRSMMDALKADAKRLGYSLPAVTVKDNKPISTTTDSSSSNSYFPPNVDTITEKSESVVKSVVNNFAYTGILAMGGAFLVLSLMNSFKRVK